jgi:drug/metabolite transporter (DMT)-like permease
MGIVYIIISSILYGLTNPLIKKVGFSPLATLIFQLGFSWIIGLPFFLASGAYKNLSFNNLGLLIIASAIATLAYVLGIKSLPLLPLWQVTILSTINPISTALFAHFILGEPLSPKFFLSLILVTSGLLVAVL